jgi:hypothetical protein
MLKFFYNKILILTCKTTCVNQGIMPSNYLHIVSLGNYELPHVFKSVTL